MNLVSNSSELTLSDGVCLRQRYLSVNGVRLHLLEAGSGPLVILLHGFPENCYGWLGQIPALVKAGYRVVAPDLRGYNLSEKPKGLNAYRLDLLALDIEALIIALGEDSAHVVGHDWGGVIAWMVAMMFPERVRKLIIINAPHPTRYLQMLWRTTQLLRSWYVFFFLCPYWPERIIRMNRFQRVRQLFMNDPIKPDVYSNAQIDGFIKGLSISNALTSGLNYYRAGVLYGFKILSTHSRPIHMPTLVIWGEKDRYLDIRLIDQLNPLATSLTIQRFADASHWVMAEHPQRVSRAIISFLS